MVSEKKNTYGRLMTGPRLLVAMLTVRQSYNMIV